MCCVERAVSNKIGSEREMWVDGCEYMYICVKYIEIVLPITVAKQSQTHFENGSY